MQSTLLPAQGLPYAPSAETSPARRRPNGCRDIHGGSRYRGVSGRVGPGGGLRDVRRGRGPVDTRPAGRREVPVGAPPSGTRCVSPTSGRRRARTRGTSAAILTGTALALLVWLVGVAGNGYEDAVGSTPNATQVVHVRAGESLNSVAARVAPDLPRQAVIDEIIELNGMTGSSVSVGQALVTPAYR